MTYYIGVDVGKQHDYTAMTIVECHRPALHITHLHRYPLQTAYTTIAADLAKTLAMPPLERRAILAVDATGLGGPFLDMLRDQVSETATVVGITITGQQKIRWRSRTDVLVPKTELVRTMTRLVEQRLLRIAQGLTLAPLLTREMRRFRVSVDRNGRPHYAGDLVAGTNDDLVLSAMYACWLASC